jgi:FkbM family methyltransferase
VRGALRLSALSKGWRVWFGENAIHMRRGNKELVLADKEYVYVPLMFTYSKVWFDTMLPSSGGGHPEVWDYSRPGWQMYRSGLEMYMPALPEEDVFDAYTHWYKPQSGDVVWDVGAHAGLTTYYLSKLVGPTGKVIAWEPDPFNYACLLRNIERHQLDNVVSTQKALSGTTGTAQFHMDGTMAAGIQDFLAYPQACREVHSVETLSLEDACKAFGVPKYIKMDIEGAERSVVECAVDFLRHCDIHWAIEAHPIKGRYTSEDMEELFPRSGYEVYSSLEYEILFTWARPGCSRRHNCTRLSNDQLTISSK